MRKLLPILLLTFFTASASQITEIELTVIKTYILTIKSESSICLCDNCFHELVDQDVIEYVYLVEKEQCCCCGME